MPAFPEQWIEELHTRSDIVTVISEYISLQQKGGRFWGLCPFHGEKTPSFSVNVEKQLFYCFGCHQGGDVIRFIMTIEKLGYLDAVRLLAQRVNLPLPNEIDNAQMQQDRKMKERLYAACREAALYFYTQLRHSNAKVAKDYLLNRGLSDDTIQSFGIGYSPKSWDNLKNYLTDKGFSQEELQKSGLLQQRGNRCYDTFRGRVMFPIITPDRSVVGFGARTLGDEQPKYLNSAENMIFNKRNHLYGLNMMRGQNVSSLVLVEGYMDVVSLHQGGITNAVATLGTALTLWQARRMKRYTNEVFLAYDGDDAGQNATLRSLDILHKEGLNVKVMLFSDGQDPDDFIQNNHKESFLALQEKALPRNEYKLYAMSKRYDLTSEDGREGLAHEGSVWLGRLSPVERERYIRQLSKLTGYSATAIMQEAQRISEQTNQQENRAVNIRNNKIKQEREVSLDRLKVEQNLLYLTSVSGYRDKIIELKEQFRVAAYRRYLLVLERLPGNTNITVAMGELDEQDASMVAEVMHIPDVEDVERLFQQSAASLQIMDICEKIDLLQMQVDLPDISVDKRLTYIQQIRQLQDQLDRMQGKQT